MKKVFLSISLLIIFPFISSSEDIIKPGETLTLKQCIEISLKMHPNITVAISTVNSSKSKVGQAKADFYPQLDLSSGYKRYSSSSEDTVNTLNEYSGIVTLTQNIYDFGKTAAQVDVHKFNLDSSFSDLDNVRNNIIFNVTEAYYGLLKAGRNRDVAIEAVNQFTHHLELAKGFYEVGIKPKIDLTKAEVDLSNAKLNLIKAENLLRIATVSLNNALGVPYAPVYKIEDNLSFSEYVITFVDAIRRAYENRPDLKSLIAKKNASKSSMDFAKKGYYPTLSGNAEYGWTGEKFPLEKGWILGATISFPIFSGFLTKYQVEEAKENIRTLQANEESLRQDIFLEVQKAFLNSQEAKDRIYTAEITVRQAEENLELAKGRYAAGVGSPIEVTDALVAHSNAKTSYIQALYDHKVAQASLEKAIGSLRVKNED